MTCFFSAAVKGTHLCRQLKTVFSGKIVGAFQKKTASTGPSGPTMAKKAIEITEKSDQNHEKK